LEFRKMRVIPAVLMAVLGLGLSSVAALAFSDAPAPDGPGIQSQFNDPDEAVENLANGAAGGSGTEISGGAQIPSGAPAQAAPAVPADAEPVNPAWPAWMVWHQQ
jgi:hypothetical protein